MKALLTALAGLGALAGTASSALAQQLPADRAAAVAEVKAEIEISSPGEEYDRTKGTIDLLEKGKTVRFKFEIASENEYAIIGACDKNCSRIDLSIFNDSEELISADLEGGSPMVVVPANTAKTLIVRLDMVDCDESPCVFGIGVYEKQARDAGSARRAYEAAKQLFQ